MTAVEDHNPPPASTRQEVRAEAGHAYGTVGADIHVFGDSTPVYLLFEHRRAANPDGEWLRAQPSRMLDARAEVVDFTGRDRELAELVTWRDRGPRFAVRWLHGAGGQGKTRLAARLAADAARRRWKVVDAVHGTDTHPPSEASQDLRLDGYVGVLVLVDYADRWPASHLSWLFQNQLLRRPGIPSRVLLLARSAAGWPAIRGQLNRLRENIDTSDQELPQLAYDGGDADGRGGERARMFVTARDCFARYYPELASAEAATIAPPVPLDLPDFGLTLAVQMAALVAVDARAHGRRPPVDMVGLTTYLLDREHENWRQLHENAAAGLGYRTPADVMARTVFTASLTGPVSEPVARALLSGLLPGAPTGAVLTDHAVCYPPTDPARVNTLEPLLPDRLAEDFLALTLPGSPISGYPTDAWAADSVPALLARGPNGTPMPWTPRGLTFLAAAADRWPHVGRGHLFPLLRQDPRLPLDADSSAVLAALAGIEDVDVELLETIEAVFQARTGGWSHVDLDPGMTVVLERLTRHRLDTDGDDPRRRGSALHTLAERLARNGRTEEALAAAVEAVAVCRLVIEAPDHHRDDVHNLAASLNGLALLLSEAERWEDAAEAADEAHGLIRPLVPADPDRYMPLLAVTLSTAGRLLSEAGRGEEALTRTEDAVLLFRELAAGKRRVEFLSSLALELSTLATRFCELERPNEALTPAQQSVSLSRLVAEAVPEVELPQLAQALETVSGVLTRLGRTEEAMGPLQEATDLHRRLAQANPDRFRPDLAQSLSGQGRLLSGLGRRAEALAPWEEALALYRQLAQKNAADYLDVLSGLLAEVAQASSAAGRLEQALAYAEEAVAVDRRLAEDDPAHFPYLATSLGNLGQCLAEVGRLQEALAPAQESVTIFRRLAPTSFERILPSFAAALHNLGVRWAALDRPDEAVGPLQEAAGGFRRMDREGDAMAKPRLAQSLSLLGLQLSRLARVDEALAAAEEARSIQRRLAEEDPATHLPAYAEGLMRYAKVHLAAVADLHQALTAAREAVSIYERVVAEGYHAYVLYLRTALVTLAAVLDALGYRADAADVRRRLDGLVQHNEGPAEAGAARQAPPPPPVPPGSQATASHDAVARRLDDLFEQAAALEMAGELSASASLWQQLITKGANHVGPAHPKVAGLRHMLAVNRFRAGDHAAAIALLVENDSYNTAAFGALHHETLEGRVLLADAYVETREPNRAIPLYEAALPHLAQALGEDHQATWRARFGLAQAYSYTGRHHDAIAFYERCVAGRDVTEPGTLMAMTSLAVAYHTVGNTQRAASLYTHILHARQSQGRPEDDVTRNLRRYLKRAKKGRPLPA